EKKGRAPAGARPFHWLFPGVGRRGTETTSGGAGTKALDCSCPPAMACDHRLLLYFALKGLGPRCAAVRGGPRSKLISGALAATPSPVVAGRPSRLMSPGIRLAADASSFPAKACRPRRRPP